MKIEQFLMVPMSRRQAQAAAWAGGEESPWPDNLDPRSADHPADHLRKLAEAYRQAAGKGAKS